MCSGNISIEKETLGLLLSFFLGNIAMSLKAIRNKSCEIAVYFFKITYRNLYINLGKIMIFH